MSFVPRFLVTFELLLLMSVSSLLSKMPESLISVADFNLQQLQQTGLLDERLAPA
jgi:hypothetical protein